MDYGETVREYYGGGRVVDGSDRESIEVRSPVSETVMVVLRFVSATLQADTAMAPSSSHPSNCAAPTPLASASAIARNNR